MRHACCGYLHSEGHNGSCTFYMVEEDTRKMAEKKHDGLPVAGYRQQSQAAVDAVNRMKELEERVLRQLDELARSVPGPRRDGPEELSVDGRWLAIARTQLEQGFMAANRAIFQPGRVALPED